MNRRRAYFLFAALLVLGVAVDVTLGKRYLRGDAEPEVCYTCPIYQTDGFRSDGEAGTVQQCEDGRCVATRQSSAGK